MSNARSGVLHLAQTREEDKQGPVHSEHGFFRRDGKRPPSYANKRDMTRGTKDSALSTLSTTRPTPVPSPPLRPTVTRSANTRFLRTTRSTTSSSNDNGTPALMLRLLRTCSRSDPPCGILWVIDSSRASSPYLVVDLSHDTPQDNSRRLLRKLPWLSGVPSIIDMSTAAFAEDVRVVDPVRINKQSTPFLEARRQLGVAVHEAEHLSEAIAKEGQAQNLGKAELFPQLHGAGSHLVTQGGDQLVGPSPTAQGRDGGTTHGTAVPPQVPCSQGVPAKRQLSEEKRFCCFQTLVSGDQAHHWTISCPRSRGGSSRVSGRHSSIQRIRVEGIRQDLVLHARWARNRRATE